MTTLMDRPRRGVTTERPALPPLHWHILRALDEADGPETYPEIHARIARITGHAFHIVYIRDATPSLGRSGLAIRQSEPPCRRVMWAITEAGRELVKQAPPIVRDRPKPVMTPEAERLFRENQRLAFCFANRLAREWDVSPQDRADLEQEALIGLWRAAIDFRPELGNQFVSLVYVAVRNRCSRFIRVWRHHRPTTRVSVVKTQPVDPQPGPCDQADRTDRIELLRRLLTERLTSDEQRAVMAILEGSSVKGHARLVGIGRAAASYRLHQAAKKLNLDPEFFTRIGSRNRKSLCHGGQASC